jgi:hypothetical protein
MLTGLKGESYAPKICHGSGRRGCFNWIGFRGRPRDAASAARLPAAARTAFYIGAQIGGAWGSGQLGNFSGFDPFTGTFLNTSLGGTPSGVIGGGHVGYQIPWVAPP